MQRYATYPGQAASGLWATLFAIGMALFVSVAAEARQGNGLDDSRISRHLMSWFF